jgi:diaminopimelate decarboxylase
LPDTRPPGLLGADPWWLGEAIGAGDHGLTLEGHAVAELARRHATPLYLYSRTQVRRQAAALRQALESTSLRWRIYYALKANRHPPLVEVLRDEGVGIDACSPREVALALELGFPKEQVSVTGSMLSNRDLDAFAESGVHLNLDSLSALRRWGERVPRGTGVGLRLDPGVQVGYSGDPKLDYGNSKFGFYPDQLDRAVAAARDAGLRVDTLHIHCGWGLQMGALPRFEWALRMLVDFARGLPGLEVVNVGGGLGARRRAEDAPLGLGPWASALEESLSPLDVCVACEPGTLLVDSSGVLVVEVNTVEEKWGTNWAGVDAGHAVNLYAAHYGLPMEIAHVARPLAAPAAEYTIAGNINESNDVFAQDVWLPELREGDLLALLPAGAYGSSMASDHCLRGMATEVAL